MRQLSLSQNVTTVPGLAWYDRTLHDNHTSHTSTTSYKHHEHTSYSSAFLYSWIENLKVVVLNPAIM
jgi:hypothetical protein